VYLCVQMSLGLLVCDNKPWSIYVYTHTQAEVDVSVLREGDLVRIMPGLAVPCDGVVICVLPLPSSSSHSSYASPPSSSVSSSTNMCCSGDGGGGGGIEVGGTGVGVEAQSMHGLVDESTLTGRSPSVCVCVCVRDLVSCLPLNHAPPYVIHVVCMQTCCVYADMLCVRRHVHAHTCVEDVNMDAYTCLHTSI